MELEFTSVILEFFKQFFEVVGAQRVTNIPTCTGCGGKVLLTRCPFISRNHNHASFK